MTVPEIYPARDRAAERLPSCSAGLGVLRRPCPMPASRRRAMMAILLVVAVSALFGATPARGQDPVTSTTTARVAAEDELDAATAALATAEDEQFAARQTVGEVEAQLRELSEAELATVLAHEEFLRKAQELVVSAYVRGGSQADLDSYLDAEKATDAVLRLHLTEDRVDVAQTAASDLRTARAVIDESAQRTAATVADATGLLAAAEERVARAENRQLLAREALADAMASERLALAAARDADLSRLAAEERAEAAARTAAGATAVSTPTEAARSTPQADPDPVEPTTTGGAGPRPVVPAVDDDQAEGWAALRECESGGNYAALSPGGLYRGAYQFAQRTWESLGGQGDPAAASPSEQDYRARLLYDARGAAPWPLCGRYLR